MSVRHVLCRSGSMPKTSTRRHTRPAESLSLAFVAFNAPGNADFVIEAPTPISEAGREVTRVFHYSRLESLPAANRLFACE